MQNVIMGTPEQDMLIGTAEDDVVRGGIGSDYLRGGEQDGGDGATKPSGYASYNVRTYDSYYTLETYINYDATFGAVGEKYITLTQENASGNKFSLNGFPFADSNAQSFNLLYLSSIAFFNRFK